jgi:hypothetical protein
MRCSGYPFAIRAALLFALAGASAPCVAQLTVVGGVDNPPDYSTNHACFPEAIRFEPGARRVSYLCDEGVTVECRVRGATFDTATKTFTHTCDAAPVTVNGLQVTLMPAITHAVLGSTPRIDVLLRNTSAASMTAVSLAIAGIDACAASWSQIGAGQVLSRRCNAPAVTGDRILQATVAATAASGPLQVVAQAAIMADRPRVRSTVSPAEQQVAAGQSARIEAQTRNIGLLTLQAVDVADEDVALCAATASAPLQPGETFRAPCTLPPITATRTGKVSVAASTLHGASTLAQAHYRVVVTGSAGSAPPLFKDGFE